jgi:hypothetical protein
MGAIKSKSPKDFVLNEQEIELLTHCTTFSRDEIIDWHEGFVARILIFLILHSALICFS